MTKVNVDYDHDIQVNHPTWKRVPWLERAYKQAANATPGQKIVLEEEETITKANVEQARLDQLAREQGDDNYVEQEYDADE